MCPMETRQELLKVFIRLTLHDGFNVLKLRNVKLGNISLKSFKSTTKRALRCVNNF